MENSGDLDNWDFLPAVQSRGSRQFKIWGPGIIYQVIMDEVHRLRSSRTPIGKCRNANATMLKMDFRNHIMHIVFHILSLEPQYKWMLMATPLVNRIEDLHWIMRFLESSCWLTLQLSPDTLDYTLNFDDHWLAIGSNVSGTECRAVFMPVADRLKNGPEFGSLVCCKTIASDAYMLPINGEVGKLRQAT